MKDPIRDAVTDAYLKLRPHLVVGRVAFTHPVLEPYPRPLPEGIECILIVTGINGETIHIIEGDGLPLTGRGMALRSFHTFDEMAKAVGLAGTPWA